LYAHVLGAELIWLDRIEGQEQSVAVWPPANLDECLVLSLRSRRRYAAFLDTLHPRDCSRSVSYCNSAGRAFKTPLVDILLHVALHGSYHRGQISMLLRDAGSEPRATDYIAFVRGAPSATREEPEEPIH
jgi:uncharacterized damage-inducible protein DinB